MPRRCSTTHLCSSWTNLPTASGITAVPLIRSSKASYTRPVEPVETRQVGLETLLVPATANPSESQPQPHILAVAVEGSWLTMIPGTRPFRVVVVGDADFVSNSFFPYMANSDLLLSMVRWLVREERAPAVASRIPVPALILLTRPQMRQIFLVTEVLLPLSILSIGACIWWKRR